MISALQTGVKGRIERSKASATIARGAKFCHQHRFAKTAKLKFICRFMRESDGVISMISIREGTYVKPGMMVMQIQDYVICMGGGQHCRTGYPLY